MGLFLSRHLRHSNGNDDTNYSLVENRRYRSGKIFQRQAIYIGELDLAQHQAWSTLPSRFSALLPSQGPELTFPSSPKASSFEVVLPKTQFSNFSL